MSIVPKCTRWLPLALLLIQILRRASSASYSAQLALNAPIPDVAPFDRSELADPLFRLADPTRRAYIRSLFSPATYHPPCRGKAKPLIEPVYYWPGEHLSLECRLCLPDQQQSGRIRHWAWLGGNNLTAAGMARINATALNSRTWSWVVLDGAGVKRVRARDEGEARMPNSDPKAEELGAERQAMRFVQRDGRLWILAVGGWGVFEISNFILKFKNHSPHPDRGVSLRLVSLFRPREQEQHPPRLLPHSKAPAVPIGVQRSAS